MNLEQLETFLAVARTESFTKAGPLVHRTQSAVSRQIQELERSVGVPLFERLGKRVLLTDAGRTLFCDAPKLLQQAETLRERLRDIGEGISGELRIGATISAANTFIPDVLARFRRRHPSVSLSLLPGQTRSLANKLRHNELDVAVLGSEVTEPGLTTSHRIADELVLVASPDHPLATKKTVHPKELEGMDFIFREPGSDSRSLVEKWLAQRGVVVKTLMALW
jgi:DNA-binding transcriptional LysR family regulator